MSRQNSTEWQVPAGIFMNLAPKKSLALGAVTAVGVAAAAGQTPESRTQAISLPGPIYVLPCRLSIVGMFFGTKRTLSCSSTYFNSECSFIVTVITVGFRCGGNNFGRP